MTKVVLDTNVVVSAVLKQAGREASLLGLALAGKFRLIASEAVLDEYERVLHQPRLRLSESDVTDTLAAIRQVAVIVEPSERFEVTRDIDDNKFVECAAEAKAQYIVTGNVRDFPKEWRTIRVVTPREFSAIAVDFLD